MMERELNTLNCRQHFRTREPRSHLQLASCPPMQVTDAEGEFITEWQVPRCTIGGLLVTEVEVVVADTRGHRLIFYAFSPKRYRRPQRDLIVGEDGPSDFPGQFNTPSGLARMSNGNIVVADRGNNRVQVLSDEGEFLDEFGERGDGDGELQFPIDVSVDSADNIYVCDSGNHRVCVFSASGDFLRHIGGYGTGNGQLSAPVGVLVIESAAEGRDEELVVADSGNNRVQVFSTKGSFLWYTEDDGEDKFSRPRFLGVAKDGDILVADDTRAVWFAPAGDDAGGGDEEKEVDAADEAAVDVGEGDEEGQSGSDVGASVKGGSESDGGEEDDAADGADGSDVAEHGESAESAPPSPERRPGRSPGRAPPVSPISSPGKGESRAEDPAGFALSPETPAQPSAAHELDMSATPAGGSDDDDGVDFNTTMRPGTIRRELALDAVSSDSGGDHDSDSDDSGADQSRLSGEGGGEGGREGSGGSDAEETQAGAAASIDASQSKRVVKKRRASRSATHGRTPRAGKEPEFVAAREDMEAELQELRREYGRIELERKAAKDRVSELKELTTRVQKELRKYGAKLLAQQAATAPPVQVRAVDRKYPLRGDAPPNYEKCRDPIFLEERILDLHVHVRTAQQWSRAASLTDHPPRAAEGVEEIARPFVEGYQRVALTR